MSWTSCVERHTAAYRWLLGIYPEAYRREVGAAAAATFRDLCGAAVADSGAWGLTRLWAATLPRLIAGGLAERMAVFGDGLRGESEARGAGPPYAWALLSAALVLTLYAVTLAPTTAFWDTSEYIATAHVLGIPHPPGNPLFVVLARSWEILLAPLGLSVAIRTNLLSAFMSAAAHGFWFLVVHHVLCSFARQRVFRLVGASAAVLVSATAFTVWSQSNVNEKVYTVSLFTIALLSWLAIRLQASSGARETKLLVLMAFILALSVGNHLMALLAGPALVLYIAIVRPRTFLRLELYPALLLAGMAGLTIHLFLPIRAALDPVINQGAPLCESIGSALGSIMTYGRGGCEALGESLNRNQYQKPPVWERQAPFGSQLVNYLQYFDWQWSRGVDGARTLFSDYRTPFTALFTGLGVWGAMEHHRRDRRTFWYFLTLFATLSVALVFYLNFEYGYSITGPAGVVVEREVRERDYFFIVSFSMWGLWAGLGIAAIWLWLSRLAPRGLLAASPVLLLACVPLFTNASRADRSGDYAARDWAYNLLQSVEPYGVLFTAGDNDTFPLWYLQEVEGVRRDVTVVVTSYLNVPWYAKQLRDLTRPCMGETRSDDEPTRILCQREYVGDSRLAHLERAASGESGGAPLAAGATPPRLPIMQLDDDTIERIGGTYVPVHEPLRLRVGSIEPVIPAGQYIEPWHQYALAIVDTAFADDRPVYWSSYAGDPASLGFEAYLFRQGLAFKLHQGDLREAPPPGVTSLPDDSPLIPGTGRWLDVPRTQRLMNDVFVHRSGIPHWDHWPDPSSRSIPAYYGWAYYSLALAAREEGDIGTSDRYAGLGEAWMQLAS